MRQAFFIVVILALLGGGYYLLTPEGRELIDRFNIYLTRGRLPGPLPRRRAFARHARSRPSRPDGLRRKA